MERLIHIGVYRILRRFGALREEIKPSSNLSDLFEIDDVEWNCFMFFLESKFNVSIRPDEEVKLVTVNQTIELLKNKLHEPTRILNSKMNYAAEVA